MRQKKFRWFFAAAIIYALFKIAQSIVLVIPGLGALLSMFFFPIAVVWVIFAAVMLVVFIRNKKRGLWLVLPIYYIFDFMFSFLLGLIITFVAIAADNPALAAGSWMIFVTAIMGFAEILFAGFMLLRI